MTGLPSIVEGMVNAPDAFLSQPVIVTESLVILYFKWGLTDTASAGLTSSLGAVGFLLTDSEPTDSFFSPPHPPRSRGSDTNKTNRRKGFMGYFWDSCHVSTGSPLLFQYFEEIIFPSL